MESGAASSRALRLALALYNIDQMQVASGLILSFADISGSYMGRASKKIASWIAMGSNPHRRALSGKASQIDRRITHVLSGKGPMYALRENATWKVYRIVGNVHYDEEFAEILLNYAIHPNVKGSPRSIRESLLEHFVGIQCEEAFLLPSRQSVYMNILEDIMTNTTASFIRGKCLARLHERGEFEILRRDGTYKILMSVNKQPKRGARTRASELIDGVDRLRVVHTLTTQVTDGAGATAGAKAAFSESRDNTISFIGDTLSVPDSAARYAEAVRILPPDRALDLEHLDTWAVLPNILCVAIGPLRRCAEVES